MLKDLLKQNRSYRGYDETGSLTREQLLINASRVYRMAKKLTPRK